jgi:hypothetical protein
MMDALGRTAGPRAVLRGTLFDNRRLGFAAAVLLVLVIAAGLGTAGLSGNDLAAAAVQKARSLLDLIGQRSPGERTESQLVKTKHRHVRMHQRALAKVRHAPPALEQPVVLIDLVFPRPAPVLAATEKPIPLIGEAIPPPGTGAPPLFFPSPLPPSQTPPTSLPPVVGQPAPPLIPAVPEPATWVTMLLGFVLMGWRLQQRTRRCELRAC